MAVMKKCPGRGIAPSEEFLERMKMHSAQGYWEWRDRQFPGTHRSGTALEMRRELEARGRELEAAAYARRKFSDRLEQGLTRPQSARQHHAGAAEVAALAALERDLLEVGRLLKKWRAGREAFRTLLDVALQRGSFIVHHENGIARPHKLQYSGLFEIASMARHCGAWIRGPEEWHPTTRSRERQIASLARHLMARYPVPAFMDDAWSVGDGGPGREAAVKSGTLQRFWISHAQGQSFRTDPEMPLPLTRRMYHCLLQAPATMSFRQSFRWAQAMGLGAPERMASQIAASALGRICGHEDFWRTVVQFFANNPMMDPRHVGPIVDFLQDQRFLRRPVPVAGGEFLYVPPQPRLSMKGRTVESLLNDVRAWHRELMHRRDDSPAEWAPSGFVGLHHEEGAPGSREHRIWRVKELTTRRDLEQEGRAMHHCVSTYASTCARGNVSIWSMTCSTMGLEERVLTMEVENRSRTLVQARAKFNKMAGGLASRIMVRWAGLAGIKVSKWAVR